MFQINAHCTNKIKGALIRRTMVLIIKVHEINYVDIKMTYCVWSVTCTDFMYTISLPKYTMLCIIVRLLCIVFGKQDLK